jgi:hypothetical protein
MEIDMTVKINKGDPTFDGQYIGFINSDQGGFLQPRLLTWHGGRWHYWRKVYYWIGPIPVLKIEDFDKPAPTQEFDL